MAQGFAHVALYTSKLEQTARFYEDVFGWENMGFFEAATRGCWLKLGDDILELFESEDLGTGAFKHIAIACDDVDAVFAKALASGGSAMVQPKEISLKLSTPVSARIAFVTGINGEEIELFCTHEA